ncbi:MAG: hypothetical protein KatS3mg087_0623 [Patescibacteria group bacterium]|nr:MAG: hypothetical protein KatS3mg087_0623 [Patescibacteria group bacterium]
MRINGIPKYRLMPVDALGNPNGDVYDLVDSLQKVPVIRAIFVDKDGKPIAPATTKSANQININDVGHDIWLLAGDANTKSGVGVDTELDYSDTRILQYAQSGTYDNQLIVAKEPLRHAEYNSGEIGFGLAFARWYASTIPVNRKVVIVPVAENSATIDNWSPVTTLHLNAIAAVNDALALPGINRFVGVLWMLGINDEGETKTDYIQALDNILTSFRNNITNAKKSYLLLGELPPTWVNNSDREALQEAIQETSDRFFLCGVASSTGLTVEANGTDYTAVAQRTLGKRFFDAYLQAISNTESTPLPPIELSFDIGTTTALASWQGLAQYWLYQYKAKNALTWSVEQNALVPTVALSGLSPDTVYQFRVKAVNQSGESSFTTSEFTTVLGVNVPTPLLRLNFNLGITQNTGSGSYTITVIPPNVSDVYRVFDDLERPNVLHIGGAGSGIEVDMSIPSSYTKSLWFKQKNSFNPNPALMVSANTPGNTLYSPGTDLVFTAGNADEDSLVQNTESHLVGVWYHVAVTYDNTTQTMKLFINGNKVNEAIAVNSFPGSPSPLRIGKYTDEFANNGVGYYDDVQVWGEALTEAQVYQVYLNELI